MKPTRTEITGFRCAFAAATAVVAVLATTPMAVPAVSGFGDKINHVAAFYVLALLADYSTPGRPYGPSKAAALLGYGLLIEIVQYLLPYRSFSLWDLAADAAGLALYGASLPMLRRLPGLRRRWRESA